MADFAQAFMELRLVPGKLRSDVSRELAGVNGKVAGEQTGTSFGEGFKGKSGAAFTAAVGTLAKVGVATFATIGVASIKMAADYQAGLTTLVTGAGEAEKNLKMVGAGMLTIATDTGTSTKQLTAGMFMIESAGFHGAAGLTVLRAAAQGAKIGNADLGVVANALTTVMKDYGAKAGTAAQATDGLMAIVSRGKVHLQDLASSMARVLPTAAALNISFADVGGAMATMTGEGTSARLAAMGLNATILALSVPSKVAAKEMATLGLSSKQVADDLTHKGLIYALNEVQAAALRAGPVGSAPYVAAMKAMLGGTNGLRVGLQLTGIHMKDLVANTKAVGDATHSAGKDVTGWALVQKDVNQQMAVLKARVEVAGITIGQHLLPAISSFLGFLTRTHLVIPTVLGVLALLATAIVAQGLMWVATGLKATWALVKMAAEAVAWAAVQSASLIETAALWVMYTLGVQAAGLATVIATGGIILIVAALVIGIYELYKHWGTVWGFVKRTAMDVYGWIKTNWPLLTAILLGPIALAAFEIYKHWDTIRAGAVAAFNAVKGVVTGFAAWVAGAFAAIGAAAAHIFGDIAGPVIREFDKIKNFVTSSFNTWWASNGAAVKQVWQGLWTAISVVFHAVWDPIAAGIKTGWAVIQVIFTTGTTVLKTLWSGAWTRIEADARAAWALISGIFTTAWAVITTAWRIATAVLQTLWSAAWAVITTVARAAWTVIETIFAAAWGVVTTAWRVAWALMEGAARAAWATIQVIVKVAWDTIVAIFTVFLNLITGRWHQAWVTIQNWVTQVGNAIRQFLQATWNAVTAAVSTALGTVVAFFGGLRARILGALGNLLNLLVDGGRNIITGLMNGIKAVWSTVTGWFSGMPGAILHALGIKSPPAWAIDAGGHIMNGLLKGMAHGASDVKGFFTGLASSVTGPLKAAWGTIKSVGSAIGGFLSNLVGGGGSGVERWRGVVLQALSMLGLSSGLANQVLFQMNTESGGNPNAINNTDSNAAAGDPSRGLLQTIGSTFAAYHVAGTSNNIYDPLANTAAAINYARSTYGPTLMSGGMGMGSGHGYFAGGAITEPITGIGHLTGTRYSFGERGPEWVTPGGQQPGHDGASLSDLAAHLDRIAALMGQLINTTAAVPAGVGQHVGGVIGSSAHDAAFRARYPQGGW